ncbi:MAG: aminotransferase class IV [Candidatus Symbiobacter sp.]|nr:aminotransferase class IV [Candidatus Symbiobacter sp.]
MTPPQAPLTATKIWLNGAMVAASDARIDPADRGFLLADGVFATALVRAGQILWWEDHLSRLVGSAAQLGIDLPDFLLPDSKTHLDNSMRELWQANEKAPRAALRLTLTRGVSTSRGIWPPSQPSHPTLMAVLSPLPPPRRDAISVIIAQSTRRNEFSPLSRIKSLAYGDAILARREAAARHADDALLLNGQGHLACASVGNVFLRYHSQWLTPPLAAGILPGLARARLFPILAAEESVILPEIWQKCEAMLLSNSLGLTPVREIDGRSLDAFAVSDLSEVLYTPFLKEFRL